MSTTIFFDLETTSVDTATCEIISLYAQKGIFENGVFTPITEISLYFKPNDKVSLEIQRLTGLSQDFLNKQRTFAEQVDEIANFFADASIFGGHNIASFDCPVLIRCLAQQGVIPHTLINGEYYDTLDIERKRYSLSLAATFERYTNKKLVNNHNAEADVNASITIFTHQQREIGEVIQPLNIESVRQYQFKKTDKNWVFTFGKHKNKDINAIFQSEADYIEFLLYHYKSHLSLIEKTILCRILDINIADMLRKNYVDKNARNITY